MTKSFIPGDTITIQYQETIYNEEENIGIKFISLIEDSRCPVDLVCYWEGNAKILFRITKNALGKNFALNTYKEFTTDTVLFGYSISLIKVMPLRHSDSLYSQGDYSADLAISKQ